MCFVRYTFVDILRAILLSLESMIEDPELQVNGFILIIDWSNFTFKQASKLTPSMLRLAIEGLQVRRVRQEVLFVFGRLFTANVSMLFLRFSVGKSHQCLVLFKKMKEKAICDFHLSCSLHFMVQGTLLSFYLRSNNLFALNLVLQIVGLHIDYGSNIIVQISRLQVISPLVPLDGHCWRVAEVAALAPACLLSALWCWGVV